MKLKCNYCSYEWNYGGDKRMTASCPDCRRPVKIDKQKITGEDTDE